MHTVILRGAAAPIPVGKIVCLGRNYHDHIAELGNAVPERPVLFMKPASCIVADGGEVAIPASSQNCHHEAELAVLIGRGGRDIPESEALEYVAGYGVAIDLTLRDVQDGLKQKGLPWELAKAFPTACPLSAFVPAAAVADPGALQIRLSVNGALRQDGATALMIRPVARIVAEVAAAFGLEPGDILLTGTPAGVGRIVSGDTVRAWIERVASVTVTVR